MKVSLYAVFDSASRVYDGPVAAQTDEVALRNFGNMAGNTSNAIGLNPECFSLWKVGEWDDGIGEVIPCTPECLAKAIDLASVVTPILGTEVTG